MNTNFQTIHQMGNAISDFVKQATGRDNVQNIDMDHVTVAQNHVYEEVDISGQAVRFNAGAEGLPFEKLLVQIEPVQDLHGYDHPWPAGGGENILPMPITSGSYANSVTVEVNNDLSFYITKTNPSGWTQFILGTFTLTAGTYTLIESDDSSQNASVSVYNTNTNEEIVNTRYNSRRVFTLEEDTEVRVTFSRSAVADNVLTKLMLFSGDTAIADDYAPYSNICPITGWTAVNIYRAGQDLENPTVFQIAFPSEAGTVYGGTLDAVTGELVVDRAMVTVGQSGWTYYAQYVYRTFTEKAIPPAVASTEFPLICSMLPYDGVKYATQFSDGCIAQAPNANIYINDSSCTSVEQYYAKYKDASIVYWLATPVVYNLTPQQITTLLGQNNIWADTGDIEAKFTNLKELY